MTNTIEVTKREMYTDLKRVGGMVGTTHLFKTFEASLEAHLEALRQEDAAKAARIGELYSTAQQWQDLHAELQTKFEDQQEALNKAQMLSRSYARQLAGTEESPAVMAILGALVDAQRIMTDWLVPDGVRARDTVKALLPVLDNQALVLAMREFEQPKSVVSVCGSCHGVPLCKGIPCTQCGAELR